MNPALAQDHLAVSVVVSTYNRRDRLSEVITPLLLDEATQEVIVVIDGSRDGSHELMQEWAEREERLKVIWQENAGEGPARAAGLAAARAEVVMFVDDDVVADVGLVSGHARMHACEDHAVVLGWMPTRLPSPRHAGQAATFLYAEDYERVCSAYEQDQHQVLLNFWAGNFSLRRVDALRVELVGTGGLGYHADKQFGYRCLSAGLRGRFSRELVASHLHERSLDAFRRELRRQVNARKWFAAEHPELETHWLVTRPHKLLEGLFSLAAEPNIYPVTLRALLVGIRAAGRARAWPLETFFTRVLRQVELLRDEPVPADN